MPTTVRLAELYDKRAAAAAEVRMIMAEGKSVSDEIKAQRKKIAGKTPKEKLLYFWEYYRIPALVTILVIAFAGNLIYTIAKVFATAVVMVYNFITRKIFLEKK